MKKILLVALVIMMCLMLVACNEGLGPGKFKFSHVHICDFNGNCSHATITKWYESSIGIELNTKEFGTIWLSEGTYILYDKICPVCGAEE